MYSYIVYLLSKKHSCQFGKEFRRGYKSAWINNIKDYTP